MLRVVGDENRKKWDDHAGKNLRVKTTLSCLGGDVSANILYHGHVPAKDYLQVSLGIHLLAVPSIDRLRRIVAGDK